ncbi:hypothetical protein C8A00DRAFT_34108 [Chaetomidium leptoderma]|uniref:Nephrocystin 3-like N-terminal domain-containing protein n=1 Tax=Chaetomidium leptoderma TaxID=669021 RepID=A0AAN6VMR8_9PEZI|nr:hypothetical protein C8A00DRAFT_34108 [Chaetomidium leptoderma]
MLSIRRYYYKNKLVIFAADAVKWYDWKQVYNEIKEAEEDYRQCSSQYYQESALSAIRSLDVHLQQQERQDRYNDTINQWSNYRTHRTRTDPPELLAGTGGWFFKHPAFTAWSGWTPPSRLLLLKANPGCGKSVLASEVVKRLEEEGRLTVCHFFFKEGSGDSSAETALCAILHQLLSRHGELLDRPMKGGLSIVNYAQQNKNAPPERKVEVLWDILEAATHDYESQNVGVVCVLDALNECESQVEILNLFEQRLRQCSNKALSGIRFLITSRFTFSETAGPSSRFALIDVERIETDAQASRTGRERERDFERVIQHRVESITASSSEQTKLKKLLGLSPGQPQRSLLWVDLVFKFLAQKKKKANFFSNWLSNVELLPQTVDDAYGRLLEQSEQHWSQKDDLITIFQIIIAARRALRLRELCEACAIHGGDDAMVQQARAGSLPIHEFKETIQQKCGFFLVLDEEENVAFFHQTAQDFLRAALSPRAAGKTAEHSSWKGSVDVTSAHTLVAQICAQSIFLSLVDEDEEDGGSLDVENPSMDFKTWAMRKPFFPYAARMLDYHLENSSIGTEAKYRYLFADAAMRRSQLRERPNRLSDKLQMLSSKLLALEGDSTMPPSKLMSINPAATDDFPHLMAVGPAELSVSIGAKNGPRYSKLLGTLSDSYFSRFELLGSLRDLEQAIDLYLGAETRGPSYGGGSKASQRLESFVKLLLEPGAVDMNAKAIGQKFSQRAAASGKAPIVKLLLSTGKIDVGGRDEDGKTALWWAIRNSHHAIVWLLFETGKADIEPDQEKLLFRWAASRGNEEIVRRLVNTDNFDLNARDSDGTTAIWQAAKYGRNGIIDLLVRTGRVEIDARDSNGQTPLGRAAQNGLTATADLLLSTGKADPDARDKDGRTPLWHAASHGNEDVVKLLILSGETVDLDAKDTEGQSPLWIAAVKGHKETVRVLLSSGNVDPDTRDSTGRRLQSVAAEEGLDAIVEMLAGHTKQPT